MENSSDIVISDDYFILNVWLNVVSSKIPIKFGKYRVLDSVDFNNNLLTIEFLTDETLFEYLDQEIADDSLQLLFTTKVSKQKVQNDFKALTDEIYSNNIIIKLVFVSDGIPQKKKTYTYSVSKMKKVLEIE